MYLIQNFLHKGILTPGALWPGVDHDDSKSEDGQIIFPSTVTV